jgi:uncharacterized protein YeaO (DUF488 family)
MAIRIVRLGSPRASGEGVRLGTVRRPPRGVPKHEFASRDFYDVWLPILSPSDDLLREYRASLDERTFARFARKFRAEMKRPDSARTLDLLAALSWSTQLSLGCYCADEARCHRRLLREMLLARGADVYHELSAVARISG